MRMCEYANNLLDMGLLFYSTDNNRRIVYDNRATHIISLLFVGQIYGSSGMVFPRMYGDLDYIDLDIVGDRIIFNKTFFEESFLHELNRKYVDIVILYNRE